MSVSSLYSLDESLYHLDIVWSGGTRSREAESWGARDILGIMISISSCDGVGFVVHSKGV